MSHEYEDDNNGKGTKVLADIKLTRFVVRSVWNHMARGKSICCDCRVIREL
jgi:ferredoxin-thioredoxin reductase catalytic subunit